MAKTLKVFTFAFLLISLLTCAPQAQEDVNMLIDEFYDGLADVIEYNMDDPDQCVIEVDEYYVENQATVERIRRMMEEAMVKVKDMMDGFTPEYGSMTEEEMEALEQQGRQRGMPGDQVREEEETRYAKVLSEFTLKHPQHGLKVVMKGMELMPRFKAEQGR